MMARSYCILAVLAAFVISSVLSQTRDGTAQGKKRWTAVAIKCKDVGRACAFMTKQGYCRLAPGYMSKLCMKSCNLCGKMETYDGWAIHMKYKGDERK